MIYFDHAATSYPKPKEVVDAVSEAMMRFGNASRSFYPIATQASTALYELREKIAHLFHIEQAMDVAFTANATESLNIVIQSFMSAKDHVITTVYDHNSVLRPLFACGCEVSILPMSAQGMLCYDLLPKLLQHNTKAVVCTHASNLTGNIVDLQKMGDFCKKNGLLFILDVSQTAGFLEIDLQKNNIDIACFTGHKSLLGPQGTGGIVIRDSTRFSMTPRKVGGSGSHSFDVKHPSKMPDCFEAGTMNVHSLYGLSAALDVIKAHSIAEIQKKELKLLWAFYEGIRNIPSITIYGDFTEKIRCPVIAFNILTYASEDVALELYDQNGIASRAGAHCAPRMHQSLGTVAQGAVRFSFSFTNTMEEIDQAVEAIRKLVDTIKE